MSYFNNQLFGRGKKSTRRGSKARVRQIERLESRNLRAVDVMLSGGVLQIEGDDRANVIEIRETTVGRSLPGITATVADPSGKILAQQTFRASSVDRLVVDAGAGDDTIHNLTRLPSLIRAGDGVDRIHGGSAADELFGGDGRDYLYGYGGDDYLDGGQGNDYLFGHMGDDLIYGDEGDDRLYGGTGTDRMLGGAGRDVLYGGHQYDYLDGGVGYDYLDGQTDGGLLQDSTAHASSGTRGYTHLPENWFDIMLKDPDLRSMAQHLQTVDNTLDRTDMLSIFDSAGQNGVSQTELWDLRQIANAGEFQLGMPDYVQNLARKVVHSNAANAHFQGNELGDLTAGSSQSHLQALVGKWFLGQDRPVIEQDKVNEGSHYRLATGLLFKNGVERDDVVQHGLSDCYYMASLAAVADVDPEAITDMFIDNGDGTFTLQFFVDGYADYVTVDRYLPADATGNVTYAGIGGLIDDDHTELWVALAEKAYVQLNESGEIEQDNTNSYAGIEWGYSRFAMWHITNQDTERTSMNAIDNVQQTLLDALQADRLIILSSPQNPYDAVTSRHAFAVTDYDATTNLFAVYNPYGLEQQFNADDIASIFNGATFGDV